MGKGRFDLGADLIEEALVLVGARIADVQGDLGLAVIVRNQRAAVFRVGAVEQIEQLGNHLPGFRHPVKGRVAVVHRLVGVLDDIHQRMGAG